MEKRDTSISEKRNNIYLSKFWGVGDLGKQLRPNHKLHQRNVGQRTQAHQKNKTNPLATGSTYAWTRCWGTGKTDIQAI